MATRQSLEILKQHIRLETHEVLTGTQVFDWTVPREWNIYDAFIKNSSGGKIVDFRQSNLHVLNYSTPIHQKLALSELRPHLFSIPEQPEWIPYRTSYYQENWGFLHPPPYVGKFLEEDEYEVFIDASLESGSLTYGDYYLPGEVQDEILISCHCCHPSLGNDNLSGIVLSTILAKHLSFQQRHFPTGS